MIGGVAGCMLALMCMKAVHGNEIPTLLLANDGPSILAAEATFTATLSFADQTHLPSNDRGTGERKLFVYIWEQTVCGLKKTVTMEQDYTCAMVQSYTCPGDVGWHTVSVTVKRNTFIFKPEVVTNTTKIQVTNHINGNVTVSNGVSCNYTGGLTQCDVVATNKSTHMQVNIRDPSDFFKGATLIYHWMFGDGVNATQINQPGISHIYNASGHYGIAVNVTASFSDGFHVKEGKESKTGILNHRLHSMDSIKHLTIQGQNELKRGEQASYNISCHASLPIDFCWYVIPTTTHTASRASEVISCNKTRLTDRTWLVVGHQFNSSGGYNIGVFANNTVSRSNADKSLHAEDSTNPQQIAGLTAGILFGVVGCLVCVAVVTAYVKRQRYRHVEIANFDFQGSSSLPSSIGTKISRLMRGARDGEGVPFMRSSTTSQLI